MTKLRTIAAALTAASLVTLCGGVGSATSTNTVPGASRCELFPQNNVWHSDVSTLPVHARSGDWMRSMGGPSLHIHPDFGRPPYGMPFAVVGASFPKISVRFRYRSQSDKGPYPFGRTTPIEGGQNARGDRHALVIDKSTCTLYELYAAYWSADDPHAGSGAIWDLASNQLRPAGWTSADAAGLPILPGLLRLDEVLAGNVDHAIRLTAERTDTSYLWPARHQAGEADNPKLPPMGARFRMKSTFAISGFSAPTQAILRAMKTYGLIIADNGTNWYFTGTRDQGWTDEILDELKSIPAGAFEAVDESSLMIDPDSAEARQP